MRFSIFRPPQAESRKVPVVYWLSGLTCTEENFMAKSGAQKYAAEHGLLLVAPDTSPRGAGIEGEEDDWDFGSGASFYVNATTPKWSKHYRMYDYLTEELPAIVENNFPVFPDRQGIMGHSMGGHGALVLALKNPGRFLSVSAFAPICAPSLCAWGQKAFANYLGEDKNLWADYDASELVLSTRTRLPILIDQGTEDDFMETQLLPQVFKEKCESVGYPLTLRFQEGYDHSYYFISSFIADHLQHHAKVLNLF